MANLFDDRTDQILRYGCPTCGGVLDYVVSDFAGVGFRCNNFDCPDYQIFETFKKADRRVPKSERKIVEREKQRAMDKKVREAKKEIERIVERISGAKERINVRRPRMEKCKEAYKMVADLKLFLKGERVFDAAVPFMIEHPLTGDLIEITSINTKRRAKAMLNALWWKEKHEYNKATKTLADCRAELREIKDFLKTHIEKEQ